MTPLQAVRRGVRTVNGTVAFCMFGLPVLCGLAALGLGASDATAVSVGVVAFLPCWFLAWAAWSVLVPRWRVWAYERVDDLGELKQLAFEHQLLWPDGHFFEKTEFRTPGQRRRLDALERAWKLREASTPN